MRDRPRPVVPGPPGVRRHRLRLTRSLLAAVLCAAVLVQTAPVLSAPAGAAPPPAPATADPAQQDPAQNAAAPDAAESIAAARATGRPAEILSRRTERSRTLANPDGSWTTEVTAAPTRVRRPDGTWTPVDTTLRHAGGQVVPVAAAGNLRLSAGGTGPAARLGTGGREVSLGLPWPLPAPELSGSTATYRDVQPGVDLVLTAEPEGFSEVLVLRERAAAANPALRTLRLSLTAAGLTLRAAGGGFEATDGAGRVEFTSPAPRMWDSTGDRHAAGATADGVAAVLGAGGRSAERPVGGDRVATMATSVSGTDLTITPDHALLDDPATVFPVYVDPSVTAARSDWAMIQSGFGGDDPTYKFTGDQGVGLCDVQLEPTCNADNIKRLAWEFTIPSVIRGSHVLASTFSAYETHAYDCTADAVQLWRTGAVSSSTTWDNHASTWAKQLASVSIARKSGCTNGPGWVEFNALGGVNEALSSGWSTLTLGLRAGSETSMPGGWKRFRYDATLSVTYNSVPRVPTSLSAEGTGCGTSSNRPGIPTATPTLRAVVSDPDTETDLRAAFAWEQWNGTAWTALGSGSQSSLTSGATGQYKITSGLVNDGIYRWRAQTQDPWSYNGTSGTDSSTWSGYCEFRVDTVSPQFPPGVSSPVYGTDLNTTYGAVGLTADFTFTASGVTDVTGYRWGWSDPPTTHVAAPSPGATVTVPLTPPPPKPQDPTDGGQSTLYVISVDSAGRTSPLATYVFVLGPATAPVGVWDMGEPSGSTTLADTTSRGTTHPATLTAGAAGTAGRIVNGPAKAAPTSVAFNGTTTYAATAGPVLDTSRSFTVSAWAKLNSTTTHRAVLCQDGASNCGFALEYLAGTGWALDMYSVDGNAPAIVRAAHAAAPFGVWTHLVAVYDAGARQIRLYVNGKLAGSATLAGNWRANGPLLIGRARYQGTVNNFFDGSIAEVKVWDRVVSAQELAPGAATLVGRWRLDGDGTDATAYGRDATATGGVTWADDRGDGPVSAASFNGTNQFLATAGPAVYTDQSYTVAGWVRWTGGGAARTALAQDGTTISGFFLGCRTDSTSYWSMLVRSADSTSSSAVYANAGACVPGGWVQLTAVRDAVAGQLSLYLDGVLAVTAPTGPRWQAGGAFTIGRGKWNALITDFWTGDIDDVRVYAGAMPPAEVSKLAA
ncbi:LamG-like jellyroll fold domain-containing protein [Dactylosporangium sp. NPDC050688]|uniref:LamG-like jellyroll fold domain-containing protein n=1 Tax=Dactylosporangium sp. NPDC050688 TaxID=3157217 RepID=UPI00340F632C